VDARFPLDADPPARFQVKQRTHAKFVEADACLTYAVARYFNMNPRRVPFFVGYPDWQARLVAFYRRRGLRLQPVKYKASLLSNARKLYLVQGLSPRSKANPNAPVRRNQLEHAVLYRGNKPYYDGNGRGKFLKGKPRHIWLADKISRPKTKSPSH
jgi:hypothetical protein